MDLLFIAYMINQTHYKMGEEITYPFPTFNGV